MRKYFIGFIAGILVATAGVAAADTLSLVGKKIQSEAAVTLDGKQIDTAIIVDGKSYAPVRSVAEATGLKVGYKKGNVKLETQTQVEKPKSLKYWEQTVIDLTGSLERWEQLADSKEEGVQSAKEYIAGQEEKLSLLPDDASETVITAQKQRIEAGKAGLAEQEAELAERWARVAETKALIAEAEAEIAKLSE